MSHKRAYEAEDDGIINTDKGIYVDMAGVMQVQLKEEDGSISVKLFLSYF